MCLTVSNKTPFIAENDIECYKIYEYNFRHEYVSPYYRAKMPVIGELTISELDEDNYLINKGFHSFISLNGAKELKDRYLYFNIFKCIIPKGARYYEGFFGTHKSYCSDRIIVKEKVYV